MPTDDIRLNVGTGGALLAGKDDGTRIHQRVINESINAAGTPVDVSATNPMPITVDSGTLLQRIEMLELLISQLLHGAGGQPPDVLGRTKVAIDSITGTTLSGATLGTVTGVGTVNAVTTVTDVTRLNNLGTSGMMVNAGVLASLMFNAPVSSLRDRIAVS